MALITISRSLGPSDVNTTFHGGDQLFSDYIQNTQTLIELGRVDLNPENRLAVVRSNSPYQYRPNQATHKGVLLIHGLFDSPFTLQDVGRCLCQQGFLVRSVLLPGHGTVPGDLIYADYREWVKAVNYGVANLQHEVKDIYLVGYSIGTALSLYYALQHPNAIKGLVLLAPALRSHFWYADYIARIQQWSNHLRKKAQPWFRIKPQLSTVRYSSMAINAAVEACKIMALTRHGLEKKPFNTPMMMITTEDDESVSPDVAIKIFHQQRNPQNRLLHYSNVMQHDDDPRVTIKSSAYPEQRILNLSHLGLPISPHNPHYGRYGNYIDFGYYYPHQPDSTREVFLGANSPENLKKYVIQRLSYNPDFDEMMAMIENFLQNCDNNTNAKL